MKRIAGFLFRRGLVYLLLVLALLAFQSRDVLLGKISRAEADGHLRLADQAVSVAAQLDAFRQTEAADLRKVLQTAQQRTHAELNGQLATARGDLARLQQARQRNAARFVIRSAINPEFALSDGQFALREEAAQRKVDLLADLADSHSKVERAAAQCNETAKPLREYNARSAAGQALDRWTMVDVDALKRANAQACAEWEKARQDHRSALQSAMDRAAQALPDVAASMRTLARQEREAAERALPVRAQKFWADHEMGQVLLSALGWLAAIMATPYLIRVLFYYVFAPIAERRGAIRLHVPNGSAVAIPSADRSAASVAVRIGGHEELLVRQGFLQSTSTGGAKRWVMLLDWAHPLASLVTGLSGLTRIRGEGQLTTISASADPFAEVTELAIPEGGALVLHPRALVAVVQPVSTPLRITSRWRLFSLNAWLTLQLRFFVFHGPARLVIRGGRGVRVELAGDGRIFAQDQLVGFSADLSYSVTRNEVFIPYLLGRESLFRDRVEKSDGILIIEEAPLALRGGGQVKRGLEGAFDAALKAFGM